MRQNLHFFLLTAFAGVALRVFFLLKYPQVTADSTFYAELAKNWLLHGVYARTYDPGVLVPSYSRLPGYPAFLAFVFALFGLDNFRAVMVIQLLIDLGTCFIVADLARRCISGRATKAAFVLTALCPFLAQYASAALTETLEIFFTALAMDFVFIGLNTVDRRIALPWVWGGISVGACILLRPDGGLLLVAVGVYLGFLLLRTVRDGRPAMPLVRAGIITASCALAPLVVWGARNWRTLHQVEFLAPRYATEPAEYVPLGFNRWVNTWIADFTSTEEIYWNMPGDRVDPANLPSRAFDTPDQRERTLALLDSYNQTHSIDQSLDARFTAIAEERIHSHPLRYYVTLPLLKIADMWLRPRTEMLPPENRWFEFDDDPPWIALALGFGILNLLYIAAAAAGLVRGAPIAWAGLGLCYIVLRSLFLGTLPNPEPRYTLECYPVVILYASALWGRG